MSSSAPRWPFDSRVEHNPDDDHYPYKKAVADEVLGAVLGVRTSMTAGEQAALAAYSADPSDANWQLLVRERETAGGADGQVTGEVFLSAQITVASEVYIEAQEQWRRNPSEANRAAMDRARDVLVAARQAHRAGRTALTVVTTRQAG